VRPTLSVTLTSYGAGPPPGSWHEIVDHAALAEAAGVDRILLTDHVVMGEHTGAYPYGEFPFAPDVAWLEPLTTVATMAARTSRVRFSTKILIAPLRPAPLLAKTLATLDVLSRGRIEVGVATGWQREEYRAAGLDWERRGRLLTDTIAACRALWSEAPASFRSESLRFDRIWCSPRPLQDRIPVWFAGRLHARNVARICTLGDGWIPEPYAPPEALEEGLPRLREAWARAGRDPAALGVQGDLDALRGADGRPDLRASLAAVPRWVRAGATTVNVVMSLFAGRRRAAEFFDMLASEWPAASV
jgi:probable F420-dependent oxidoreductase